MPNYRRSFVAGGTFFFTVVTFERRPILTSELARRLLRNAWKKVQQEHPFSVIAVCLLPDHFHCLISLPEDDWDYPLRWRAIKGIFSREYKKAGGEIGIRNEELAIWQRRYWEHQIRDEADLKIHFDYLHYNPVKHGLVNRVMDWPWSSFHRYFQKGYYGAYWGNKQEVHLGRDDIIGE